MARNHVLTIEWVQNLYNFFVSDNSYIDGEKFSDILSDEFSRISWNETTNDELEKLSRLIGSGSNLADEIIEKTCKVHEKRKIYMLMGARKALNDRKSALKSLGQDLGECSEKVDLDLAGSLDASQGSSEESGLLNCEQLKIAHRYKFDLFVKNDQLFKQLVKHFRKLKQRQKKRPSNQRFEEIMALKKCLFLYVAHDGDLNFFEHIKLV